MRKRSPRGSNERRCARRRKHRLRPSARDDKLLRQGKNQCERDERRQARIGIRGVERRGKRRFERLETFPFAEVSPRPHEISERGRELRIRCNRTGEHRRGALVIVAREPGEAEICEALGGRGTHRESRLRVAFAPRRQARDRVTPPPGRYEPTGRPGRPRPPPRTRDAHPPARQPISSPGREARAASHRAERRRALRCNVARRSPNRASAKRSMRPRRTPLRPAARARTSAAARLARRRSGACRPRPARARSMPRHGRHPERVRFESAFPQPRNRRRAAPRFPHRATPAGTAAPRPARFARRRALRGNGAPRARVCPIRARARRPACAGLRPSGTRARASRVLRQDRMPRASGARCKAMPRDGRERRPGCRRRWRARHCGRRVDRHRAPARTHPSASSAWRRPGGGHAAAKAHGRRHPELRSRCAAMRGGRA